MKNFSLGCGEGQETERTTMNARLEWLTDPTVFRVNQLDAHSDHVCYACAQEAERGVTSLRQSLDGQ